MRKNLSRLSVFALCCFSAYEGRAQDTIVPKSQIDKAILTFANLVDSQDVAHFQLKNIAQLKSLKAGRQFKRYIISLDSLKNYKQGGNVNKLIKEYPSVEVALVDAQGKIVTGIEFVQKNNKWVAGTYGASTELLMIRDAQNSLTHGEIKTGKLIRIPALRMSFLSVTSAVGMEFISLQERPNSDLHKAKKESAAAAISELVLLAKKRNQPGDKGEGDYLSDR